MLIKRSFYAACAKNDLIDSNISVAVLGKECVCGFQNSLTYRDLVSHFTMVNSRFAP
jgi:hypothetical protein